MYIPSQFQQFSHQPDLAQLFKSNKANTAQDLNCVRIGIVQEFYPENLTAQVVISGKRVLGLNPDGSQVLQPYAPIYAKVCYCNPFETFPLKKGDECVLLFNDRELESWFINGGNNPQAYPRMHDLTDCIAIAGIRSLPQMISIIQDCLHLFYGNSSLQLKETETDLASGIVNINATTINLNGNVVINGQPYLEHTHSNGNNGSPTGGVIQ